MARLIFDNSNIAESYAGTTTPLTFSFAQYVYQEVYKNFCSMMGVPKKTIAANERMFGRMIVFVGYRFYYDLLQWYRLVSFLPGYAFNRGFLEKMLGVQKTHDYAKEKEKHFIARVASFVHLFWQMIKITAIFCCMGMLVRRFNRTFDKKFAALQTDDLQKLPSQELAPFYFGLGEKFLSSWRVPIANDFAVMVSTGIAEKLGRAWLGNSVVATLLVLGSRHHLVSLDPGRQIERLLQLAKNDAAVLAALSSQKTPAETYASLVHEHPGTPFVEAMQDYIHRYGSRMPNELKLETATLREEPWQVIILLRHRLFRGDELKRGDAANVKNFPGWEKLSFFRRSVLRAVLHWSHQSLVQREETRFRRALIFGVIRSLFLETGRRLAADGSLSEARDIFFLETEEIFALLEARALAPVFQQKIAERKKELHFWQTHELPRRIEREHDILIQDLEQELRSDVIDTTPGQAKAHGGGHSMVGMVVSTNGAQRIEGEAIVLREFEPTRDFHDKILVARHTDPGWTMVFSSLKGLVVERGGMLSHAAIVARELGIPCIVGVADATEIIADGQRIHMHLSTGTITHGT